VLLVHCTALLRRLMSAAGGSETRETDADVRRKKAALRRELRQRTRTALERLGDAGLRRVGESVCRRLLSLPEFASAPVIAGYAAMPGEVELERVFEECNRQGKEILLPRYRRDRDEYEMVMVHDPAEDTVVGWYGIREPRAELPAADRRLVSSERVLWCVPGLGFDPSGVRLGRGRGYYDRLLGGTRGVRVGVAFDWQILPEIPYAAHDVRMHLVVTDRRVLRCIATSASSL